jgi:hypothetical protein
VNQIQPDPEARLRALGDPAKGSNRNPDVTSDAVVALFSMALNVPLGSLAVT